MTPFEYIAFLTSIVIALGITRILTGFGKILQFRGGIHFYWVHTVWAGNVFLWLLLDWWILYRWRTFEDWTFFLLLFVLLSPIATFLLTVLLFPEPFDAGTDLKDHFLGNHRWFFAIAACLPLIDAIDTLLKGRAHFIAQGPLYVVTIALLFVLCVIGAITRRERFHAAFGVFFFLYILVFIAINLRLLM